MTIMESFNKKDGSCMSMSMRIRHMGSRLVIQPTEIDCECDTENDCCTEEYQHIFHRNFAKIPDIS